MMFLQQEMRSTVQCFEESCDVSPEANTETFVLANELVDAIVAADCRSDIPLPADVIFFVLLAGELLW
jgi:hypothetical protein